MDKGITRTTPSCRGPIPAQKTRGNSVPGIVFSHTMPKMDSRYSHRFTLPYLLDRSRESTVRLQTVRSFIIAASSPVVVAPVSLLSWSTYVIFGLPLPRCPCVGSHRIRRCAPSSGCLWQCPASRSLLAAILSLSFGSFPYRISFVTMSLQCTSRAFLSILV